MDILAEKKITINPENVVNFEEDEEEKFKAFVKYELLEDFIEFLRALNSFYVNFVTEKDMPGTTAAVNPEYRIIFINNKIAWCLLNENDPRAEEIFNLRYGRTGLQITDIKPLVSMLLRHELLHCMLEHHKLAVEYYSKLLGYDYNTLTDELYDEVMDEMWKPCLVYRNYNDGKGIPAQNGAGDYHLSIAYLLKDIEICEKLGGLVLENNSKMVGYDFKKLLAEILKEETRLKKRLYPIVEGKWVAGVFEPSGEPEKPSWFSLATEIAPEDVREIRLITISNTKNDVLTYKQLRLDIDPIYTWINDEKRAEKVDRWSNAPIASYMNRYGDISNTTVEHEFDICPILKVENLHEYSKLQEGSKTKCFGLDAVVLPGKREILILESIGKSEFNDYGLGPSASEYKDSFVQLFIKDWLKEKLIKYKVRK